MSDNVTQALIALANKKSDGWGVNTWVTLASAVIFALVLFWPYIASLKWYFIKYWLVPKVTRKGRHVLFLCHNESMSLFNLQLSMISLGDAGKFLKTLARIPEGGTIEMIINTPGGMVLAAEQIANAMRSYKGTINVYVARYAMSGGTLLALAGKTIYMAENAVLGHLDPQLSSGLFEQWPCASILAAMKVENSNRDDKMLVLADVSRKAVTQMQNYVAELLSERMDDIKAYELAIEFTNGCTTHDYAITFKEAQEIELWVSQDIPEDIKRIINAMPTGDNAIKFFKGKKQSSGVGVQVSL